MNSSQYKNIQDPIARAEAMRAEAIANAIFDGAVALRNLAKAAAAKVSGYFEYRRTVDVLSGMTDRELDDIGITRGDIPAVARGVHPRPAPRRRAGERRVGKECGSPCSQRGATCHYKKKTKNNK